MATKGKSRSGYDLRTALSYESCKNTAENYVARSYLANKQNLPDSRKKASAFCKIV